MDSYEHFNEDEAFRSMLMVYTHFAGVPVKKNPAVLDVGCGKCLEAKVVADFFGGSFTGIDINDAEVEHAKKLHDGNGFTFISGDAKRMPDSFEGRYDLLILRHANSCADDFPQLLAECHRVASPEGILIATFYSNPDFDYGARSIRSAGYRSLLAGQNKFSFAFSENPVFASGIDRYIVVASREELSIAKKAKKALARLFCVG